MHFTSILTLLSCLIVHSLSSNHGPVLAPLDGMDVHNRYLNEYLVILHGNCTLEQHFENIGKDLSGSLRFRKYTFGYQATMDDQTRDEHVRRDPGVRMVESNRPAYGIEADDVEIDDSLEHSRNRDSRTQKRDIGKSVAHGAPYGLQMLTTPSERLDVPVKDGGDYTYLANAGQGVQVYIMDTGIRTSHERFQGRARHFGGLGPNDKSPYVSDTMADARGHGTQ